jgi:hypothetical protein
MEPITGRDAQNRRVWTMYDNHGVRFRCNVVEPGGLIPLHSHSYGHHAAIHGPFQMIATGPDGERIEEHVERGIRFIPAGWVHTFIYLGDTVGSVDCFWPIGTDKPE